jgi:nitrate/TMAO reductase-like tetraheme cytochrome c subunit
MAAEPGPPWWKVHLLALVVLAVVVGGGVATAGLWKISSSPRLCNSCHIMEPYVQAWKVSKHAGVTCVKCHYPPGLRDTLWVKYQALSQVVKWATHTYSSKPFAEVEDASCLRSGCHDRSMLSTRATFKGGVAFDHATHLAAGRRGPQLRCTSCHTQVVVTTHIQVATSTCFLCHFKGAAGARELRPVGGCTGCHRAPPGQIVLGTVRFDHADVARRGVACQSCHLNVVEGDGAAPRERCTTCHNRPDAIARYGDQPFIHATHVTTHNIECGRCHSAVQHRLPPPIGLTARAASSPSAR